MTNESHIIHWNNIGIIVGTSAHELCDVCKKDCKQQFIHYVIKCSRFECEKKYEDTLKRLVDRGRLGDKYDQ